MNPLDLLHALRKRWALIVAITLVCVAGALAVTLTATPQYESNVQLFVAAQEPTADLTGVYQGGLFTQQRVQSYADIADNPPVTVPVIRQLGLRLTPSELSRKIHASAPSSTVLINIGVTDPSPGVAQRIAAAVGKQFIRVINQLEQPQGRPSPVKVSVSNPANLPASVVSPKTKLNLVLGALLGLALGLGVAFLRERLDTTVKGIGELTEEHNVSALGVVPYEAEAVKRPILDGDRRSTRGEAFRQLRTNLQFVDLDMRPDLIVITSSLPGEGKTTTACNLAITMADAGVDVILVEGDLRRPRMAKYLDLESEPGLTDVLLGEASVQDALRPWGETGKLRALPSGPLPPNPSELLASRQMADLLRELRGICDVVLVDAPPLLPVTDAALLATGSSGAVVVVRCGSTKHEQLKAARAALAKVDARILGAVLSMAPEKGPGGYYYSGYY